MNRVVKQKEKYSPQWISSSFPTRRRKGSKGQPICTSLREMLLFTAVPPSLLIYAVIQSSHASQLTHKCGASGSALIYMLCGWPLLQLKYIPLHGTRKQQCYKEAALSQLTEILFQFDSL